MLSSIMLLLTFLLFTIVPLAIIIMIIIAIIKKNKDGKPLNFDKVIKSFYTYIVLIIFLFLLVGSIIYAFDAVANYLIPEKFTGEIYENQMNNLELQKMQEERFDKNQKNNSIVGITTAFAMVLISAPIFIYHSRIAKEP